MNDVHLNMVRHITPNHHEHIYRDVLTINRKTLPGYIDGHKLSRKDDFA